MGPSRVLHLMNPLRHDFIASCLADHDTAGAGLKYLDVGCGGGIFAESIARTISSTPSSSPSSSSSATRAASVLGIDPSPTLIRIAREHARTDPIVDTHLRTGRFEYRNATLEALIAAEQQLPDDTHKYDVVTLFEVLEHIDSSSPMAFLANCLQLVRPGGWLIGSTIARSLPSLMINRIIAEAPWPIGVVPRGTHEWSKFVNPDELRRWLAAAAAAAAVGSSAVWRCTGVVYFPGLGWRIVSGSETWGNYFWGVRKGIQSSVTSSRPPAENEKGEKGRE